MSNSQTANQSTVNSQITDAVQQTLDMTAGNGPRTSLAMSDAAMAQAMGLLMTNAVTAQQNARAQSAAATAAVCADIVNRRGVSKAERDTINQKIKDGLSDGVGNLEDLLSRFKDLGKDGSNIEDFLKSMLRGRSNKTAPNEESKHEQTDSKNKKDIH